MTGHVIAGPGGNPTSGLSFAPANTSVALHGAAEPIDPAPSLARLVGGDLRVPCLDGTERQYINLDFAASTPALPAVAEAVTAFMPWYSSVHRGAGFKSRRSTDAYESARATALAFSGGDPERDVAIICRNTTEAINHLTYRLALDRQDVVLTTVVEHHANLLPWGRVATRRYVECETDGTFTLEAVIAGLRDNPRPKILAITGASNVSGWLPPLDDIIDAAHEHGVRVVLDAAQLAPHHPIPLAADFVALSGHKLYAPYGSGVLVGPRSTFAEGEPFLAGGGAVDLVDLDEVVWSAPPERDEAGSPNVVGAVAMEASMAEIGRIGWGSIEAHEAALANRMREGLDHIEGVRLLGPPPGSQAPTLAVAAFVVDGVHHALVAARLSAEWGIGVRHGCFCAHPYLMRLLGLGPTHVALYRDEVRRGDHRNMPGAVRASCGLSTTTAEIDSLLGAVRLIAADAAAGTAPPVPYEQDPATGDFWPVANLPGWSAAERSAGTSCARG